MAIFNSYVKLPEGIPSWSFVKWRDHCVGCKHDLDFRDEKNAPFWRISVVLKDAGDTIQWSVTWDWRVERGENYGVNAHWMLSIPWNHGSNPGLQYGLAQHGVYPHSWQFCAKMMLNHWALIVLVLKRHLNLKWLFVPLQKYELNLNCWYWTFSAFQIISPV